MNSSLHQRLLWSALVLALLNPSNLTFATSPPVESLSTADQQWVDSSLAALSLEQKAAQMVMVRIYGRYHHPESSTFRRLEQQVRELGVGGVVLFDSDLQTVPRLLDHLQGQAALPLLVAADFERGINMRIRRGAVEMPWAMAIGASRSTAAARFLGEITAREGRALGVHWAFAPVVDVNNNPANPVINLRSFGEQPELVGELATAFIAGARGQGLQHGGMMTTAKHFPGHGDTAVDSHLGLPTLDFDFERLEQIELRPFRQTIAAGVDAVMVGHIAVPAIDPSGDPATLSPLLTHRLLRQRLGFEGLIVTDAMGMEGVAATWFGAAAVRAVAAGTDVVLMPPDPRIAIQSLARAVAEGQLTEERLDHSVRRLLEAKARLGLHRQRLVGNKAVEQQVARPADSARALAIAQRSITVLRDADKHLPLHAESDPNLLLIEIEQGLRSSSRLATQLDRRKIAYRRWQLGPEISPQTLDKIIKSADEHSHILLAAFIRPRADGVDLSPSQLDLAQRLAALDKPLLMVSLGSPYLLAQVPGVDTYFCAWGSDASSQAAAIGALFGEFDIGGQLPVSLPGLYDFGHGLRIPRHPMSLERTSAAAAGFRTAGLAKVEQLLDGFVSDGAFPGGIVAVGHRGKLALLHPFGKLSYAADAAAVTHETLYDLASLTKVIATTTMAMILVDEKRLDLDARVDSFLPLFRGAGKEQVTLRHLLTHSSGLDWWAPLFETLSGQLAYIEHIQAMELVYAPGSDTKYSDLGIILLGEILERVAGESLEHFFEQRIAAPLGMTETLFRPGPELLQRIAPTEHDSGRGRLLRGEVHDENAFALGGVAPHAGLFATAGDLARFVQMLVNGGVFEHRRIISRSTLDLFTHRANLVAGSDRAIGWDTKSAEKSSAGDFFAASSYGHTGFTGTSIWIDPERRLFLILLTNRVHPTRENNQIRKVRPALANAVMQALADP